MPRNVERAAALYDKGCSLGDTDACIRLARQYEKGTGVEQDDGRAAELRNRASGLRTDIPCPSD